MLFGVFTYLDFLDRLLLGRGECNIGNPEWTHVVVLGNPLYGRGG